MRKFIYLIGYPLKHSVSREFQQAALDYYGLDIRYEVRETTDEELSSVVEALRESQSLGANVTLPYKEKVLPFLAEVEDFARIVGAVNTVVNRDGRLVGYNTDVLGFLRSLGEASFKPEGKEVVILGAGGAARAVGFALVREAVARLTVVNRTQERAEQLVAALGDYAKSRGQTTEVIAIRWQESELQKVVKRCQLIVNCTTLGMKHSLQEGQSPLTKEMISEDALVYDLVYNPRETPLLKIAQSAGARTVDGLPMLIYQGAIAFEYWTGLKPPLELMFKVAQEALLETGG